MPDLIQRVDFTPDLIPEFTDVSCGSQEWAIEVSTRIKATDPNNSVLVDQIKHRTRVWLYLNAAGDIVGFGSLGTSAWSFKKNEPKTPISIIPMLAVADRFWGKPKGDG